MHGVWGVGEIRFEKNKCSTLHYSCNSFLKYEILLNRRLNYLVSYCSKSKFGESYSSRISKFLLPKCQLKFACVVSEVGE